MDIDYKSFKRFAPETVEAWGKKNYGSWMPMHQSQSYEPQTPAEEFFRYYTRGAHTFFNKITRCEDINSYDFSRAFLQKKCLTTALTRLFVIHPQTIL